MTLDPNQSLAQAYALLQRGDVRGARGLVAGVLRSYPTAPSALSLMALVELTGLQRQGGDAQPALAAFAAAIKVAPRDPQLFNNLGNLHKTLGATDDALDAYRKAISLNPNFADAHANFGIVAQGAGRYEEALPALQKAAILAPTLARAWSSLGLCLRELGQHDVAAEALDRALALDAKSPIALRGRAIVEAERGGPEAASLYHRAAQALPDDLEVALGAAVARHESGDSAGAVAALAAKVAAHPDWATGHEALAKLRFQVGEADSFTSSYDDALAQRPADKALWLGVMRTLAQSRRWEDLAARAKAARAAAGADPLFDLGAAMAASELGENAGAAFEGLEPVLGKERFFATAWARHLLRARDPKRAAAVIEPWTGSGAASDQLAWALLATAWRMDGDARYDWLADTATLTRAVALDISADEMGATADVLRKLHKAREHPFDQTLRGGTQTEGTLFLRSDPAIVRLRLAIEAGIRTYIDGLPPVDAAHPLLGRPRGGFRFTGSWSVRLRAGGTHVNHVHPEGWLSSACYVALPAGAMGGAPGASGHAGWLSLGMPPVELDLGLPALAMIEPKVGTLALFPSYMWHGTEPFDDGERMTVAFDVVPDAG